MATEWADAVILSDVVEHLKLPEIRRLLREALRVLERGGRLVVHTQPNRTVLSWTVPVLSRISRLWGVRLPSDLRSEMTRGSRSEYHASEQSWRSLRKALIEAGFEIEEMWLEGSYAVHRIFGDGRLKGVILRLFRRSLVLKKLLGTQLFAVARRPPGTQSPSR